ncbi:protochlorophyllide oxidoreductase [Mycobacteroides salmoniphilum]|uniref:Protochlorophyllide oxidoreductase n=1 Tax=Mycobacteroides salmoniphilum TaxID=404941 RepID=A0A4R8S7G0_9MYCO|nr:SDR family NAD(P)-dependent oxidoreductase [Mycobacteroides salmoniphilum]TDZ75884.1 protochlorophyllide oxidoreductase [Mycobacteroides salmoniphilum]TDZ83469.1 protochlorophyllide oxidoreductase [Mycobacteroides salmoniphilum]TDZ84402.1 protochlorophyllide oxidoreductase [Mycobacteroides salmoniphilum]
MRRTGNRSLVLTGATSGLGSALAQLLADSGSYRLIMLCRNERRRDELISRFGEDGVHYVVCDLAVLASVREAAAELNDAVRAGGLGPIGSVVLNAAIHPGRRPGSAYGGLDSTMVTNLIAPHLLLALLSPSLGDEVRVVFVGSGAHDRQRWWTGLPQPSDLPLAQASLPGALGGPQAYVTSKRGTVELCRAYSERAPDDYTVLSYDPGIMPATGITRNMNGVSRWLFRAVLTKFENSEGFSTAERSADWLHGFLAGSDTPPGLAYAKIDHYLPWPTASSTDDARVLFQEANEIAGITTDVVAPWWFGAGPGQSG